MIIPTKEELERLEEIVAQNDEAEDWTDDSVSLSGLPKAIVPKFLKQMADRGAEFLKHHGLRT